MMSNDHCLRQAIRERDAARARVEELERASVVRLLALWPRSFSVQPDGPGWRIDVNGEWGKIHESLPDAIDAALAAALEDEVEGEGPEPDHYYYEHGRS